MLYSKILVAYDDSELAQRALEKAIEIGKIDSTIEIQVVHVIKIPEIGNAEQNKFQALMTIFIKKVKILL